MLDLYEKFDKIRAFPALLPNSSIYSLHAYIRAYNDVCRELGLPLTEQQQEFRAFLNWLRYEKYKNIMTKTIGWSSLILYDSDNERDALEFFFVLYDEFISLKNSQENLNISPD